MLCNSNNNRPDKNLEKALFHLAFTLVILTICLVWFFLDTKHNIYSMILTSITTIYCLIVAIKTLSAGEKAISYGGFANEIIKNDFKMRRIENSNFETIIENTNPKIPTITCKRFKNNTTTYETDKITSIGELKYVSTTSIPPTN